MAATSQGLGLKSKISGTPGGVASIGLLSDIPLTRIFSGPDSKEAATEAQTALVQQYSPAGRCSWKITQFRSCAQEQPDLTLCEGFNESLRHTACRVSNSDETTAVRTKFDHNNKCDVEKKISRELQAMLQD
ncbi:coiled-coil-helix-coiled-coil-helix domain-containing protein 2-like [Topomyia yanbarensis]|uniref:coiled-coil-helix-coiled-coil-helix domain-containing protein 2-like n=1 Tax=Topomyia yanbarensis TaxID=2498891 RepID=UPI00273C7499|nr:coiled-coil-helix-coiled-coil-helix domain-containing protein 2-like [Topomyia yanbarensis]